MRILGILREMKTYQAKYNDIQLEILDYLEPNYGRELLQVKLLWDGKDVTENYAKGYRAIHCCYNLDFESRDGRFIYIPFEQKPLLFETKNRQAHYVFKLSMRHKFYTFTGNRFEAHSLLQYCHNTLLYTSLESLKTQVISDKRAHLIYKTKVLTNGYLRVYYQAQHERQQDAIEPQDYALTV